MSASHPDDAGMRAVARVRGVREQDSSLGLRRAVEDERRADQRLAGLADRLAAGRAPEGDLAGFLLGRAGLTALAEEEAEARRAATTTHTVTASAREHWQRDRTRLEAVQLLLERRAEARRAERSRREVAEVDDLVSGRWLRARRQGGAA